MAILTQLLFGLLIFFLPSNLAYHLPIGNAIVQGTLVDYLIPKIYLTDIFILGILLSWLISFARPPLTKLNWLLITFFSVTLIRGLLTPYPIAALWFWIKLVEMTLFVWWLRHHLKLYAIRHMLFATLPLAVLWQSLLALAQWLRQSSLIGYWFLGEPVFSAATPGIAKASLFGTLKVLPYGTTPHPNVLAGFLAISLVLAWQGVSLILGFITLFLTQSLSAIAALGIFITRKPKLLIILLILLLVASRYSLDATSLSRRHELNLAAVRMWLDYPLFGVGLNQFTAYLPQYTEVSASTRFLQPVHNIYLLLLAETGLVGVFIIFIIFIKFINLLKIGNWKLKIPLLMILIIGAADHYPLTLQTGQLLLALTLGLTLSAPKSPNSDTLPGF